MPNLTSAFHLPKYSLLVAFASGYDVRSISVVNQRVIAPNKRFNPTCAEVRVWYIMSPVGTRGLTWALGGGRVSMSFILDYDDGISLDAESLAEGGIAEAYEGLLPALREFVSNVLEVHECRDDECPSYAVRCGNLEWQVYSPNLDEELGSSWGRATAALFDIVNKQLEISTHRFYAINGGNDLFGMFLRPEDAIAAQKSLPNKSDWPYIPRNEYPWYGMYH